MGLEPVLSTGMNSTSKSPSSLSEPGESLGAHFRRALTRTVAAIFVIVGLLALIPHGLFATRQMRNRAEFALRVAQTGLANAVMEMNRDGARELLDALFLDDAVLFADLEAGGTTLYRRTRDGLTQDRFEAFPNSWRQLPMTAGITHEQQEIGRVRLVYSRDPIYTALTLDLGIIVLLLFLIVPVAWRAMQMSDRLIFRPLEQLSKSSSIIARGNLWHSLDLDRSDEIGFLSHSLDRMRRTLKDMIARLEEANRQLSEQNEALEQRVAERTVELANTNEELQLLLEELQEYNNQITESLHYAERIMLALLPRRVHLHSLIPDSFLILRPRDIVGGDAYYVRKTPNGTLLMVIDCTGHGVPGAFISILALSGLSSMEHVAAVTEDPASVLGYLSGFVKNALGSHGVKSEFDDGLDAAACFVDGTQPRVIYAGARIPLLGIRDGKAFEITADRHSLGYRDSDPAYPFVNHSIEFDRELTVYLCTDGLIDQLGGPRRFPFGKRRVKKLMAQCDGEPLKEHRRHLVEVLRSYQGDVAQLDDLTVLGFRLSRPAADRTQEKTDQHLS